MDARAVITELQQIALEQAMEKDFHLEAIETDPRGFDLCACGHARWRHWELLYNCDYADHCPCVQFDPRAA